MVSVFQAVLPEFVSLFLTKFIVIDDLPQTIFDNLYYFRFMERLLCCAPAITLPLIFGNLIFICGNA